MLEQEREVRASWVRGLVPGDIATDSCPLCRAGTRRAWWYVTWLACGAGDAKGPRAEDTYLCAAHLHDVAQAGPGGTEWLEKTLAGYWADKVGRFIRAVDQRRAARGSRLADRLLPRSAAGLRARTWGYRDALRLLHTGPECRVCQVARRAEAQQAEALAAAVLDGRIYAGCPATDVAEALRGGADRPLAASSGPSTRQSRPLTADGPSHPDGNGQ